MRSFGGFSENFLGRVPFFKRKGCSSQLRTIKMKRARTSSSVIQAVEDLIENTMPARRFVPKSTRPKMPWSTYKKKRRSNVSRWTRGLGAPRQADASVRVLNPMKLKTVRVQKTANWSVCASFTSTTPIVTGKQIGRAHV